MLSKFNQFPESFKGLIGLTCLTIIIFFTFLILNIFYGPDKDADAVAILRSIVVLVNFFTCFVIIAGVYHHW